jgi:hypothetical protein
MMMDAADRGPNTADYDVAAARDAAYFINWLLANIPKSLVGRLYDFSGFASQVIAGGEMRALWKLRLIRQVLNPYQYTYRDMKIQLVDWINHRLLTEEPLFDLPPLDEGGRPNFYVRGNYLAPLDVQLEYSRPVGTSVPGLRLPSTGYEGGCYSRYGITRELIVGSDQAATAARVQDILDSVKDPIISGDVAIGGPPPTWLRNLNCKLNIAATGRATGLENLGAIVVGWSYDFATDITTITVSTDKAMFLGRRAF